MKVRVQFCLLVTFLLVGGSFVVAPPPVAAEFDHLRCWTISIDEHSFRETVEVDTQFDHGRRCTIQLPAARFCVEAEKDHGNDNRWRRAGHWLCYRIRGCQGEAGWDFAEVEDQFGTWDVERVANDYFCTPARKRDFHSGAAAADEEG